MKKKDGFVFIETIITIVFLAAALLIMYGSYRNAITEERTKIYYDDIGYMYRNYYIADFLVNKTEIHNLKEEAFKEKYTLEITEEMYESLFSTYQKEQGYPNELDVIKEKLNVGKMLVVSDEIITNCFNNNDAKCTKSYEGLSEGISRYIETMPVEREEEDRVNYYLVTEYREKSGANGAESCNENEENCYAFYVTLKLDINKEIVVIPSTKGEVCEGKNFAQCLKDNSELGNDADNGLFHHDKDGEDSNYGNDEAGDDSYRYGGRNVQNYICFGSDNEKCPDDNMYRIIGVYGSEIRIIKDNESGLSSWNGEKTKENLLKGYEEKWQEMVASTRWYTEGFELSELNKRAAEIYQSEIRGSSIESKTGLMYVNEYMYASSPKYWSKSVSEYNEEVVANNWLNKNGVTEWTISRVRNSSNAYAINEVGKVGYNPTSRSSIGRMSINLKETVMLVSGEGTYEDPYRIADTGVVITGVEHTNDDYYEIDVQARGNSLKGTITRYDFKIKKNNEWSEWVSSTDGRYEFKDLKDYTDYPIKVRALNSQGNYSEEEEITIKTKYKEPEVTGLFVNVVGWHQVRVEARGINGSGNIAGFCYVIKQGIIENVSDEEYTNCDWTTSLNHSKTFMGLNSNTPYTISVKVIDNNNYKSLNSRHIATRTGYEPNVSSSGYEGWTNSDVTVSGNASGGTGSIEMNYCRNAYQCVPDTYGNIVNDDTEGIETFCFYAKNKETGEVTDTTCTTTYIDKTPPSCNITNQNTGDWKNTDHTITLNCIDNGSQCNPIYISDKKYDYSIENDYVSYVIADMAGNVTNCNNIQATIKVDKDKPTCTIEKTSTGRDGVSGKITCSDGHSGISRIADWQKNNSFANPVEIYNTTITLKYYVLDNANNWSDDIVFAVNSYKRENIQCCDGSFHSDCWWSCPNGGWRNGSTCYYNTSQVDCHYAAWDVHWSCPAGQWKSGNNCCSSTTVTNSYGASWVCNDAYCHSTCDYGWMEYY